MQQAALYSTHHTLNWDVGAECLIVLPALLGLLLGRPNVELMGKRARGILCV